MAKELKVSESSVRKVVKIDLGMRSFKRKRIHFLTDKVQAKILDGARHNSGGTLSVT